MLLRHSGVFGGTVHEAMPNECHLLSVLVDKDPNPRILVPGVDRDVSILYKKTKSLLLKFNCSRIDTGCTRTKERAGNIREH